jgi:hypothetical protein
MFHLSRIVQLGCELFGVTALKPHFRDTRIRSQNHVIRSHDIALVTMNIQHDSAPRPEYNTQSPADEHHI